jgi:hypothetical protein
MKPGSINIKFDSYSNKNLVKILKLVCDLIPPHFCSFESLDEVVIEGNKVTFIAYGHDTIKHHYLYKDGKLERLEK